MEILTALWAVIFAIIVIMITRGGGKSTTILKEYRRRKQSGNPGPGPVPTVSR